MRDAAPGVMLGLRCYVLSVHENSRLSEFQEIKRIFAMR